MPLDWFHSTTYSFFPDETYAQIRRVYTHPTQQHAKRHFCGYCGTPLSYWSEKPYSEAEYINLTLGSLLREDLADLEDMGLIPEASDAEEKPAASVPTTRTALRQSYGVPWFDGMVEGTQLGNMRRSQGMERSEDGKVSIEWEIVEFTDDGGSGSDEAGHEGDVVMGSETPGGKRKLGDLEAAGRGK